MKADFAVGRVALAIVRVALGMASAMAACAALLTALYPIANRQFAVIGEGGLAVLLALSAGLTLGGLSFRLLSRPWGTDARPAR